MAKLPKAFSTEGQPELGDFEAIPRGKYVAQIIDSEMMDTRAEDGQYLNLQFQILEGDFRGRSVWARLNLDNPTAMAVEIAYKHLTSICKAIGIVDMGDDSEVLHGKPMVIKVTVKPPTAQYEASNEVKGYEPYTGEAPVPIPKSDGQADSSTLTQTASAGAKSGGMKRRPWDK